MTIPPAITSLLCVALVALVAWGARQNTPVESPAPFSGTIAPASVYSPANEREAWAVDFLRALGNDAPSVETVRLVVAWTEAEDRSDGALSRFNPLNTTETGGAIQTINQDGVRGYASYEDGMRATVQTLTYNYPGYAEIVAGLRTNDPQRALAGLYASPWGTDMRNVESIWEETQVARVSSKCVDPIPDWQSHINVGFYAINCGAWGMQSGCQHFGTDIGGQGEGTPVNAPCSGTFIRCQDNGDSGPYIGKWIEYTADDGAEFLINHFRDSPLCGMPSGTRINAGDFIGTMRGDANHVHVQVKVAGGLVDFEDYMREH